MDVETQHSRAAAPPAPPPQLDVGRVLNVAGVCFLVLGAVFLLCYSWSLLGPAVRTLLGTLLTSGLVVGGEYLARKWRDIKWFGDRLIGGGYALGYFIVYAIQNVPMFKLIDNPVLDLTLLIALTVLSMGHAMTKRAQVIATLCSVMALVAISLNPITMFSVAALAVLSAGCAYAVSQRRWFGLHGFSCMGSYAIFTYFTAMQINFPADPYTTMMVSLGFLTVIWLSNALASFSLLESEERRDFVASMVIVNAIAFTLLGLACIGGSYVGLRFVFLNTLGGFYLRTRKLFSKRDETLGILARITGLSLVTAAVPLELTPNAVPVVFLSEMALLAYAGLKHNSIGLRISSWMLAVYTLPWIVFSILSHHNIVNYLGLNVEWGLVVGWLGVAAFMFTMCTYRLPELRGVQLKAESEVVPALLYIALMWLLLVVPLSHVAGHGSIAIWPVAGIAFIAAGFRFDDRWYRGTGLSLFGLAGAKLLFFDLAGVNTLERSISFVIAGVAFLLGSSAYAWLGKRYQNAVRQDSDAEATVEEYDGPPPPPLPV